MAKIVGGVTTTPLAFKAIKDNMTDEIVKSILSPTVTINNGTLGLASQYILPPKVAVENGTLVLTETVIKPEVEISNGTLILK